MKKVRRTLKEPANKVEMNLSQYLDKPSTQNGILPFIIRGIGSIKMLA